jgi:DNA polymerase-3 subunit epsilon
MIFKRRQKHVRRIVALDTETTGIDAAEHDFVEIACILWDVEYRTSIARWATLDASTRENEAEAINGIPQALLEDLPDTQIMDWLLPATELMNAADLIIAHNAPFDRAFVGKLAEDKPWVCSMDDITWPIETRKRGLVDIALAHGVTVYTAHRAMADADLIIRLLERCAELGHDVQGMLDEGLRRSLLPKFHYVSLEPFQRKDEVKASGFRWDPDKSEWWRNMNEEDAARVEGIRMHKEELKP